jgi:hypothetical protein
MHVAGGILGRLRYIFDPALSKLWLPILYFIISALGIICGIWDAGDRAVDMKEIIPPGKEVFDFIIGKILHVICIFLGRLIVIFCIILSSWSRFDSYDINKLRSN